MAEEIVCSCGVLILPRNGRINKSCSNACRKLSRKASPKTCLNCGCCFTPLKFHAASGRLISHNAGMTCSRECHIGWIRNNEERKRKIGDAFKGDKHPNWQGGKSLLNNVSNRGPNWSRQRAAALKRDGYACVDCGLSQSECMVKFGRGLDVDHVVPFHNFTAYVKANQLTNLQSRCASCHRRIEATRTMIQMVLPMQDSMSRQHKGYVRGEAVNTAKLSAAQVLDIRRRASAGEARKAIANSLKIEIGNVHQVVSGRTWKHLLPKA